jgi:hypothetical protein
VITATSWVLAGCEPSNYELILHVCDGKHTFHVKNTKVWGHEQLIALRLVRAASQPAKGLKP